MALHTHCKKALLCAAALLALAGCAGEAPQPYPYGGFVPADYGAHPDQRYPLIIYLHGEGDTNAQEAMIPDYARAHPGFPFLVVVPRSAHDWSVERLDLLLAEVQARFRVDPRRIYLAGASMGAFGAWRFASAHPERFAALAMVAGGADPSTACPLKRLPVWMIHNSNDRAVSPLATRRLADALKACGGDVRLTMDERPASAGNPHDAWSATFAAAPLYDWLLARQR
jgi:predicted peptidase